MLTLFYVKTVGCLKMKSIKEIFGPNGEKAGYLEISNYRIEAYGYDKTYLARFDFIRGITDRNGNHVVGTSADLEKMVMDYYILSHLEQEK